MNLGVQYYRPPFPEKEYWEEDFKRIRDSGLNTVQLWVMWGWVEAKPGRYCFDDYDALMELAGKNRLGVIISTIAEIHPYWIHREIPGSEMINHLGAKIISSNRIECHFGLTPGGCTDHPEVWNRMGCFLTEVATRYRAVEHLRGWDAWNELRWNVHADGLVCFCEHTLKAFRKWLGMKYGALDELNRSWKRRYQSFDEILPGKLPGRTYTEMMAFEHFITWRANRHGKARYDLIKAIDPSRPVTVHAASPCALMGGASPINHPVNRGNDWFYADELDGIGCSSFPKWLNMSDADFGVRVEYVASAARGKHVWLSEVQGGRAATGFNAHEPVDAVSQQHWIWNGLACGADTILFWCWRDEVFGFESSGFGIIGNDGLAQERIAALKKTGPLIERYWNILSKYRPTPAEIGILFSPQTYYLSWAQDGKADMACNALQGYARALVRKSIPYLIVEEEHLEVLEHLKLLFLPRTIVIDDATARAFGKFIERGGVVFCESECGAFNSQGFYRYPEKRWIKQLTGLQEIGRRSLNDDKVMVKIDDRIFQLGVTQWLTPWQKGKGQIWAEHKDGPLIVEVPAGKGKLILSGAYLGDAYAKQWNYDFECFLEKLAQRSGWSPEVEIMEPELSKGDFVYLKSGQCGDKKIVFVFFPKNQDNVRLKFRTNWLAGSGLRDIISGQRLETACTPRGRECSITANETRVAVLLEE